MEMQKNKTNVIVWPISKVHEQNYAFRAAQTIGDAVDNYSSAAVVWNCDSEMTKGFPQPSVVKYQDADTAADRQVDGQEWHRANASNEICEQTIPENCLRCRSTMLTSDSVGWINETQAETTLRKTNVDADRSSYSRRTSRPPTPYLSTEINRRQCSSNEEHASRTSTRSQSAPTLAADISTESDNNGAAVATPEDVAADLNDDSNEDGSSLKLCVCCMKLLGSSCRCNASALPSAVLANASDSAERPLLELCLVSKSTVSPASENRRAKTFTDSSSSERTDANLNAIMFSCLAEATHNAVLPNISQTKDRLAVTMFDERHDGLATHKRAKAALSTTPNSRSFVGSTASLASAAAADVAEKSPEIDSVAVGTVKEKNITSPTTNTQSEERLRQRPRSSIQSGSATTCVKCSNYKQQKLQLASSYKLSLSLNSSSDQSTAEVKLLPDGNSVIDACDVCLTESHHRQSASSSSEHFTSNSGRDGDQIRYRSPPLSIDDVRTKHLAHDGNESISLVQISDKPGNRAPIRCAVVPNYDLNTIMRTPYGLDAKDPFTIRHDELNERTRARDRICNGQDKQAKFATASAAVFKKRCSLIEALSHPLCDQPRQTEEDHYRIGNASRAQRQLGAPCKRLPETYNSDDQLQIGSYGQSAATYPSVCLPAPNRSADQIELSDMESVHTSESDNDSACSTITSTMTNRKQSANHTSTEYGFQKQSSTNRTACTQVKPNLHNWNSAGGGDHRALYSYSLGLSSNNLVRRPVANSSERFYDDDASILLLQSDRDRSVRRNIPEAFQRELRLSAPIVQKKSINERITRQKSRETMGPSAINEKRRDQEWVRFANRSARSRPLNFGANNCRQSNSQHQTSFLVAVSPGSSGDDRRRFSSTVTRKGEHEIELLETEFPAEPDCSPLTAISIRTAKHRRPSPAISIKMSGSANPGQPPIKPASSYGKTKSMSAPWPSKNSTLSKKFCQRLLTAQSNSSTSPAVCSNDAISTETAASRRREQQQELRKSNSTSSSFTTTGAVGNANILSKIIAAGQQLMYGSSVGGRAKPNDARTIASQRNSTEENGFCLSEKSFTACSLFSDDDDDNLYSNGDYCEIEDEISLVNERFRRDSLSSTKSFDLDYEQFAIISATELAEFKRRSLVGQSYNPSTPPSQQKTALALTMTSDNLQHSARTKTEILARHRSRQSCHSNSAEETVLLWSKRSPVEQSGAVSVTGSNHLTKTNATNTDKLPAFQLSTSTVDEQETTNCVTVISPVPKLKVGVGDFLKHPSFSQVQQNNSWPSQCAPQTLKINAAAKTTTRTSTIQVSSVPPNPPVSPSFRSASMTDSSNRCRGTLQQLEQHVSCEQRKKSAFSEVTAASGSATVVTSEQYSDRQPQFARSKTDLAAKGCSDSNFSYAMSLTECTNPMLMSESSNRAAKVSIRMKEYSPDKSTQTRSSTGSEKFSLSQQPATTDIRNRNCTISTESAERAARNRNSRHALKLMKLNSEAASSSGCCDESNSQRSTPLRRAQSQPMHINRGARNEACLSTAGHRVCENSINENDQRLDALRICEAKAAHESKQLRDQTASAFADEADNRLSFHSTNSSEMTRTSTELDSQEIQNYIDLDAPAVTPLLCEAIWDHVSMQPEELPFSVGDIIEVVDASDETADLWYGYFNDRFGWFPAAYVRNSAKVAIYIDSQRRYLWQTLFKLLANQDARLVSELSQFPKTDPNAAENAAGGLRCTKQLFITNDSDHPRKNNSSNGQQRLQLRQSTSASSSTSATSDSQSIVSRQLQQEQCLKIEQTRANVIREIISTERDYLKLLENLVDGFLRQAQRRPDMFSEERISTIFGNLNRIFDLHKEFLADLEKQVDWVHLAGSRIGESFLRFQHSFEIYSFYCNNHPQSSAELATLYRHAKYRQFFEACRLLRDMTELSLDGFLLSPIQRICKYPLQLGELVKCTMADHLDYHNCCKANETMKRVAAAINERKRRLESLQKLALWQQNIDCWQGKHILQTSSMLIGCGEVTCRSICQSATNGATGAWMKEMVAFLFDHLLILCKKDVIKKNNLQFKDRICLDSATILDLPDGKDAQSGIAVKYAIKIEDSSEASAYFVQLRSRKQKQQWLEVFKEERRITREPSYCLPTDEEQKLARAAAANAASTSQLVAEADKERKRTLRASKKEAQLPDLLLIPSESSLLGGQQRPSATPAIRQRWVGLFAGIGNGGSSSASNKL